MICMRENTYAVSEVVGALLAITIVMVAIGTVLLWGIPYTEQTKIEASTKNVFNLLDTAVEGTKDMIQEKSGSAREYNLVLDDGSVTIDPIGDRFIIMYAADPRYNFTVSGLDDSDCNFSVHFFELVNEGISFDAINAEVSIFNELPISTEARTPSPSECVNYNTVKFEWDQTYTFENYSYLLTGPHTSAQWSSWSSSKSVIFRDIPDGDYNFQVKENRGGMDTLLEIPFKVIKGLDLGFTTTGVGGGDDYSYYGPVKYKLTKMIRIDLMGASLGFPSTFLGRIYLFDLGFVDCTLESSVGSYKRILENNAVLSIDPSRSQVSKEPILSLNYNTITFRIIQLRNLTGTTAIGPSVDTSLGIILVDNYVREQLSSVYEVKMQIFGPYRDTWSNYFTTTYHFIKDPSNDLLLSSGGQVRTLLLTQSLCTVDFH